MGSEGSDPLVLVRLFVSRDGSVVFDDISDFVQTLENACLGKGIDGKRYGRAAFNRQCLRSKVDGHEYAWLQQSVSGGIDSDREQSILQAVLAEDIGEACRDHRLETEIFQRPDRVFARATAAEVIAGNKNLGAFINLKFRAVLEQMLADPDFVCDLQKASRNDLVGVDILLR